MKHADINNKIVQICTMYKRLNMLNADAIRWCGNTCKLDCTCNVHCEHIGHF